MDQDQPSKRICLGRIADAHGVKGLVKILPYGDDPALLEDLSPLFTAETGNTSVSLKLKNPIGKYYLAEIDGIRDRDGAEALKGTELFVARESLPQADDDGAFYYEDLIGLKAMEKNRGEIGTVIAVQNFGASDLLEIKPALGVSFYVPFVEQYIEETDIESGLITLRDIDGFLP